jgi:hypothetical protein
MKILEENRTCVCSVGVKKEIEQTGNEYVWAWPNGYIR